MDLTERLHQVESRVQRRAHFLVPREDQPGQAANLLLPSPLTAALVGAGYHGGQPISGVEKGPACLRKLEITTEIEWRGWKLHDLGDVIRERWEPADDPISEHGVKNPRQVGAACKELYDRIKPVIGREFMVTMGGDHSLAIGSISAAVEHWGKDLGIVWVDAHADINTETTSGSGNIHGMPLAFLCGLMKGQVPGFEWFKPCLDPSRIVYIGLRHVDFHEKFLIRDNNIKAFSLREVDKYGIGKVMDMALAYLNPHPHRKIPIHLSFDIDSIDPFVCPSTGTRAGGGLSYREGCFICETVSETGCLVGLDLVELNPDIGTKEDVQQTAEVTISLLRCALGHELLAVQL